MQEYQKLRESAADVDSEVVSQYFMLPNLNIAKN